MTTPTPTDTCTATNFFDLCGYPRDHGGPHRHETPTPTGDDREALARAFLAGTRTEPNTRVKD